MAYARVVIERARFLYAEGKNFEQISRELSGPLDKGGFAKYVAPQTISRWKTAGQPKSAGVPKDWDAFRAELEESVAEAAAREMVANRTRLARVHFDDLDQLRRQIKRAQYDEDPATGELVPRTLSAGACNLLAGALSKVVQGQRTIFGQSAYNVGAGDGGPTLPGVWLPPEDEDAEPEK